MRHATSGSREAAGAGLRAAFFPFRREIVLSLSSSGQKDVFQLRSSAFLPVLGLKDPSSWMQN